MPIKKKWVSWEEFERIQGGNWTPSPHAHVKADITDIPWAWADVSKTGSNLTDLATRQHAGLTDVSEDQHHAKLHAASHRLGGGDLIKLDDFGTPDDNTDLNATTGHHGLLMKLGGGTTNFLRADGTWATPVAAAHASSHLVGGADPLSVGVPVSIGIALLEGEATNFARRDHVHTHPDGLGANRHHPQLHAAEHEIGGAGDLVNHDLLTGFVVSEHTSLPNTIAAVLSNHTQAVHNALNIDADTLDTLHAASFALTTRKLDDFGTPDDNTDLNATTIRHGLLLKLSGVTANFLRGDGVWANPVLGAHASTHEIGGGEDLVNHDLLTGFVVSEHTSLPNTIAAVLSDHTVAVHDALNINADRLDTLHAASFALTTRKLDDFGTPDDNTDLNATTLRHGLLRKLSGVTANFLRADGAWAAPTLGAHASTHEIGGGDLVHHNDLTDYAANVHQVLPNTIAVVLNDHNAAAHNSLSIDHGSLGGRTDDDHSIYYNSTRHTKAIHDSLALDHGFLGGRGDDDHSIYYNAARHTVAIHDALNINADKLDTYHAASFMKIAGGTFSGVVYARDHGTGLTDEIVNVCYGTGNPPTANTTTIGTLFVKYTA